MRRNWGEGVGIERRMLKSTGIIRRSINAVLDRIFQVRSAQANGTLPPTFPAPPISIYTGEAALRLDTVYACVSLYSDTISTLPKHVFDAKTNARIPDHPIEKLLRQPNEYMDGECFWSYIVQSILLTGNGYAAIETASNGNKRLIPIPPTSVSAIQLSVDANGNYEKQFQIGNQWISDSQILHFCGETMLADGLRGASVVQRYALRTLQHAEQIEEYSNHQFQHGTNFSGVIEVPEMLTPETQTKLVKDIQEFHSGYKSGGGILWLDAGKKLNPISITPDDEKFIASENFSVERICRWFRTPLHLVQNGQQQSYNSNESNASSWASLSLKPKLERIESQIKRKLLGDSAYVEFCVDDLLRANTLDRYNANAKACGRPWATVNEVRASEGLPAMDGGDELFIPANLSNHSGLNNGGGGDGTETQ